jgi:phosphate transport system substrate-binding protein
MKKLTKIGIGLVFTTLIFVFSCRDKSDNTDTIIEGKATVYVDESVLPIIEDQEAVFETEYNANLHLVSKSENEIINSLLNDTAKIAILSRQLSNQELKAFQSKKINPKITPFATDAVAFIRNGTANDSLIALEDVNAFLNGKSVSGIKGLVFDNPNSSTVRYINKVSGVTVTNQKNVFSLKTNEEVIKYVAEHDGMIGIVGMNWIFQPPLDLQPFVDKVTVLAVKGVDKTNYFFPTQDNLALGNYPLARDLYIVNCQGYSGLGMGFGSFITGERGQRIILKSGLLPIRTPGRKIIIRNTITKDKN